MPKQLKELDPRLRRIVSDLADDLRMARDTFEGVLAVDAGPGATLTKRLICQISHGANIPAEYADLQWTRLSESIYSVTVPVHAIEGLASQPEVVYLEAGRALHPLLDTSIPETKADAVHASATPLKGKGVVVGIIDFGFDYTLDDFRKSDGSSRVAFLWDQGLTPNAAAGERSPGGFGFGVEYTRADIDAALGLPDPFSKVRHKPQAGSHGTHVAGTAAGNGRSTGPGAPAGRFIGAAPEAVIIFVQPASESDIGTFADSVRVADAVSYVFRKAEELGLPCAVNMSLGQNGGSHDGESVVERAIDGMLVSPGRAFICAAGNEHVWNGHASGTLATGQTHFLSWQMGAAIGPLGRDRTPNELEIWYSSRDLFEVRIVSPQGDATPFVKAAETEVLNLANGNRVFLDSQRFHRLNGDSLIYVEVSRGTAASVSTGVWKVELRATQSVDGKWDAWIERDSRSNVNSFADQSQFVPHDFDPKSTLGTPSTGYRSIAVANYDHRMQTVVASSSRGPTRDGRHKPEIAAPGANILSSGALGNRPNPAIPASNHPVRVRMSGTSMSAPHVTGIAALLLEKKKNLTSEQIRALLIASASPATGQGSAFDNGWGYGRIDAAAAVQLVDDWIN